MTDLEKFRHEYITRQNIDQKQDIQQIAEKAFWDSYEAELKESNHGRTIVLLEEIKEKIKKCIQFRETFSAELDESIDIDLLKQMIDHDVFNHTDFRKMIFYIIDKIRRSLKILSIQTSQMRTAHPLSKNP